MTSWASSAKIRRSVVLVASALHVLHTGRTATPVRVFFGFVESWSEGTPRTAGRFLASSCGLWLTFVSAITILARVRAGAQLSAAQLAAAPDSDPRVAGSKIYTSLRAGRSR